MVQCPECGNACSYIVVNGLTVSACSVCCQAVVENTKVIIRLDENKIHNLPPVKRDFVTVALAMQLMYQQWDIIAKHVSMTE